MPTTITPEQLDQQAELIWKFVDHPVTITWSAVPDQQMWRDVAQYNINCIINNRRTTNDIPSEKVQKKAKQLHDRVYTSDYAALPPWIQDLWESIAIAAMIEHK